MGVRENIKRLREERDLTQAELADALGVTRSAVTQWESGWSNPKMGSIELLTEFFGVPKSEIVDEFKKPSSDDFTDIPLYGSIAAGTPIEMIPIDDEWPIPSALTEMYPKKDLFALRTKGDSMDAMGLVDGSIGIYVKCSEVIDDNKPYAICVNGFEATCKRVKKHDNGFTLYPDSTDPTLKPKTYDYGEPGTEEITVLGKLVHHMIPVGWVY